MPINPSELILNENGSIYHLNLKPEHISDTIILVGDQERVDMVSKHFDRVIFNIQNREFKTHTGILNGKLVSVISTGIGTDNIDIVLNELDALVNINFSTRSINSTLKQLTIIRIGTSGAIQHNIPLDSFLISTHAIDLTGLLNAYSCSAIASQSLTSAFISYAGINQFELSPTAIAGSKALVKQFKSDTTQLGITITANGFYGPQGRMLRLMPKYPNLNEVLKRFEFNSKKITNLEMETAGIYGLCRLLGHRSISLNAIIANRANGSFSETPKQTIENLITYTLARL